MKNTKNEKNNQRIMKVVYFDEESAVDYINIKDGGTLSQSSEKEKKNESTGKIDTQASVEGKFSLFNFLKGSARAEIDADILQYGQNIVKSTITNTILTDYIEKANNDESIRKFIDFTIKPITNSLTYWKLYTPYTMIFKDQLTDKISPEIDIKKLDELIDTVKGYYELVAEKFDKEKNENVILRFNSKGFKNNYKLSNLLNMNLMYYGVLVGESTLKQYSVENEFDFAVKDITIEDIKGNNKSGDNDKVKIYDVFLAGVEINE